MTVLTRRPLFFSQYAGVSHNLPMMVTVLVVTLSVSGTSPLTYGVTSVTCMYTLLWRLPSLTSRRVRTSPSTIYVAVGSMSPTGTRMSSTRHGMLSTLPERRVVLTVALYNVCVGVSNVLYTMKSCNVPTTVKLLFCIVCSFARSVHVALVVSCLFHLAMPTLAVARTATVQERQSYRAVITQQVIVVRAVAIIASVARLSCDRHLAVTVHGVVTLVAVPTCYCSRCCQQSPAASTIAELSRRRPRFSKPGEQCCPVSVERGVSRRCRCWLVLCTQSAVWRLYRQAVVAVHGANESPAVS